jgi:hypothetical protein
VIAINGSGEGQRPRRENQFEGSAQGGSPFVVKHGRIQSLRRFAAVALQQAAEPLFATHIRQWDDLLVERTMMLLRTPALLRLFQQFILLGLMRPLGVVVPEPLGNQVVEVPLAQDHEVPPASPCGTVARRQIRR